MKFGIIKERKNPPDRRVVFSPSELAKLKQTYQWHGIPFVTRMPVPLLKEHIVRTRVTSFSR